MAAQKRQPSQEQGPSPAQSLHVGTATVTDVRQVPLGAQALQQLTTRSLDAESEPTTTVDPIEPKAEWDELIPEGFMLDDDPDAPVGFDLDIDDESDEEELLLDRVYPVRQLLIFETEPGRPSSMVLGSARFARRADSGGAAQIWEHRWRILDNLGRGLVELMGAALIAPTRWQLAAQLPAVSKIGLTRYLQYRSVSVLEPNVASITRAELEALSGTEVDALNGRVLLCRDWYPSESGGNEASQYIRSSLYGNWEPAGLSYSNELLSRGAISLGQIELPSGLQFIDTLLPNQADLMRLSMLWRQFLLVPRSDDVGARARIVASTDSKDTKQHGRTRAALTAMWTWQDVILATLEERECWGTDELRRVLEARTHVPKLLGDRAYWYTLLCLLGPDAYKAGDE